MDDPMQAAVECWRGQCLNVFARAEAEVIRTLEAARAADHDVKIDRLAGHRLEELKKLAKKLEGTPKQKLAFQSAMEAWDRVEPRRAFLAHAVVSIYPIAQGERLTLLDFTSYRRDQGTPERWTVKQHEEEAFSDQLKEAFKRLTGQLGHLRTRLTA